MKLRVAGADVGGFTGDVAWEPVDGALACCHWCGGNDIVASNQWTSTVWVECLDCGARGPVHLAHPDDRAAFLYYDTEAQCRELLVAALQKAVEAWNAGPRRAA